MLHPLAAGLGVNAGDLYTARLQLDHEEDEVPLETGEREHFDRKEVGSREAGPVCEQERFPRRALTPLGGRVNPVVLQDPEGCTNLGPAHFVGLGMKQTRADA